MKLNILYHREIHDQTPACGKINSQKQVGQCQIFVLQCPVSGTPSVMQTLSHCDNENILMECLLHTESFLC